MKKLYDALNKDLENEFKQINNLIDLINNFMKIVEKSNAKTYEEINALWKEHVINKQ